MAKNHYFKTKMLKMGIWSLPPNDCETWHGEVTSKYFQKYFGIPTRCCLCLFESEKGFQHAYIPENYFKKLHARIDAINRKDFKALSKKLATIYALRAQAKREVSGKVKNPKKLNNKQLAAEFVRIREWIQKIVIFDQFCWIAEEYWTPKLQQVLVNKLGLKLGSPEYNRVLFTLTKPEEISTTLMEKRAVLEQAIAVKEKKRSVSAGAKILAKQFGWLPVFTYGEPWKEKHYTPEIVETAKKPLGILRQEFESLKNYTKLRNKEVAALVKQYKISARDLQHFIEFGLALDGRNEAEYFVGFGGFYLLPLFDEIARRLFLSVKQVRGLRQDETVAALLGKLDAHKALESKGAWGGGWGWDEKNTKRVIMSSEESYKVFKHLESYAKPVQGGDESKGVCASPGVAKGKIRIVPSPTQNKKVKQGDILVTYATTTDYLPAMKRAAAIVTEVGGLTCHAAVVSREFGIPCVVALTNAMKNFKDGDMVEVDANKGTVKKI